MTRPDGPSGPLVADVRGQDARTGATGAAEIVDRLAVSIEIDQRSGAVLRVDGHVTSRPVGDLAGVTVRGGFGRRLGELYPDERDRRSLLYSALDDLSGALLVSGYALLRAGLLPSDPGLAKERARAQADVCVGWATGTPLLEALREGVNLVPMGPDAPPLEEGHDPAGWHEVAPMAAGTVRRRRRLDVVPDDAGAACTAHSHFRDSYASAEGEMVMHEYLIEARIDDGQLLAGVDVDPRVLPWSACPGAASSVHRLVGTTIGDIPSRVRRDLVGPSTCTHLNSTLRCLADVTALAALVEE